MPTRRRTCAWCAASRPNTRSCRRRISRWRRPRAAGERRRRRSRAARRAAELRPEWEVPAVLEAQILQKRSTGRRGEAPRRSSSRRIPTRAKARLNYARALILDKRLPEARKQFETLLAAESAATPTLTYVVGLLALPAQGLRGRRRQHEAAAQHRSYRDPDGARYMLGQIAEEQKQLAAGDPVVRRRSRTASTRLPARMRTANAMAKQGKLDAALRFPAQGGRRTSRAASCSSSSPRRSSCATRTATRTRSSCSTRRSTGRPSSPSSCTTTRSPPRSSSASMCSKRTCAS